MIFHTLVKAGANLNQVYREDTIKSENSSEPYQCTLLTNIIRKLAYKAITNDSAPLRSNVLAMMHFGAKVDILDSDGRDPLIYSIKSNNINLVDFLIQNRAKLNLLNKVQDKKGKSAVHFVVNPCDFGSFENVEMLRLLHKAGFPLNLKDANGKTPIEYAWLQKSGTLFKELSSLQSI